MKEIGLNPREIPGEQDGVKVINLYGELAGTQPKNPPILLVSHYDSTPHGPGAADDASGVATCLEIVRALKARGQLLNPIGVLITDGEEARGLCAGANVFVRDQASLMRDLQVVVNLEARGNYGPVIMFETGRDNCGLIRLFSAASALPVAASFSDEVYRRMPNDTDFSEFLKAGKRGYNFAFVGGIEQYHTPQDTPENLSLRTLQHYGNCVLPLVAQIGQLDDQGLERCLSPGDATYFTPCRGLLVYYPAWLARALALITTGLFVFVVGSGLQCSDLRIRAMLASLGVTLLAAVLASGIAAAAVFGLVRHFTLKNYGPFVFGLPFEYGFLVALLLAAGAVTLGLRAWLLRRTNPTEGLAGALVVWVIFTMTTTLIIPGASYLFTWPTLFGTISLGLLIVAGRSKRNRSFRHALLTAIPASLLLAPTIVLIHQSITIGIAPASVALASLALSLMPLGFGRHGKPSDEGKAVRYQSSVDDTAINSRS